MLVPRLLIAVGIAIPALANDGSATSTPAGGIQLTREPRISMEKERLTIGRSKVTVEYEFLNESSKDITTEVAFPVPLYRASHVDYVPTMDDFRIWIEGRAANYQIEAKAMVGGVEHSALLRGLGVDIASFGHLDDIEKSPDIERLLPAQQKDLARLGLIDPADSFPAWSVVKTYHWRQTFPARKVLHIRHEYKPILGLSSSFFTTKDLQVKDPVIGFHMVTPEKDQDVRLSDACVDPPLQRTLIEATKRAPEFEGFQAVWVDYILTTANTWKTPIKDFQLIIERPKPEKPKDRVYVSLCWDGRIQQRDADHFVAKKLNFVPTKELKVMFFEVPR
jgi:hypothetical protein